MKQPKILPVPGIRTPIPILALGGWLDAHVFRCAVPAGDMLRSPYLTKTAHRFTAACVNRVRTLDAETTPYYERIDALARKCREQPAEEAAPNTPTDPSERDSIRARRETAEKKERARAQLEQKNDLRQLHQYIYEVPSREFSAVCEMKATEELLTARRAAYAKGAMGKDFCESKVPALPHDGMKDYHERHKTDIAKRKALCDEEGEEE